jgi:hypothetical protein
MNVIGSSCGEQPSIVHYDREGRVALKEKDWTQAVTLLKLALEERNHHGLGTNETRMCYAEALLGAKEYNKAKDEFQKIVPWAEGKFGPEAPETMKIHMQLGQAFQGSHHLISASRQYKLVASVLERPKGEDTLESLRYRYLHGLLASNHEPYDLKWQYWAEAEESLRRAALGYAMLSKPDEDRALRAQIEYARVLLKQCKDREALSQFERSLEIAKQKDPQDGRLIKDIKNNIGECNHWIRHPRTAKNLQKRDVRNNARDIGGRP